LVCNPSLAYMLVRLPKGQGVHCGWSQGICLQCGPAELWVRPIWATGLSWLTVGSCWLLAVLVLMHSHRANTLVLFQSISGVLPRAPTTATCVHSLTL
jgi:hypothetical protein